MTMSKLHEELLSKPEIQFWIPIISTVVSITISTMILVNRINILEVKYEQVSKNEERIQKIVDALNTFSERIAKLEAK